MTQEKGDCPVFVVGPSRSGTTLVQTILNQNPGIWVARETHYFDDLRVRVEGGGRARLQAADQERCERYFLSLGHRAYGQGGDPDQSQVDRRELRDEALQLGGSGDAYFEAYCRIRARQHGRPRWGEKTPRHVFRIDEILAFRPGAKIVCLARDPRAVAASYRDWKRKDEVRKPDRTEAVLADRERASRSYNVVINALLWRAAMRASLTALRQYGPSRVRILRYEDVASDPVPILQDLAGWLDLPYDPAMVDVPVVHSSYALADKGVSTAPVERWRTMMSPAEVAVIQTCCREAMGALGYKEEDVSPPLHRLALTWAGVPAAIARSTFANRGRLGKASGYLRRRVSLAFARNGSPRDTDAGDAPSGRAR